MLGTTVNGRKVTTRSVGAPALAAESNGQSKKRNPLGKRFGKPAREKMTPLADEPDLFATLAKDFQAMGLVGESKNAKLYYLAGTSRLLEGENRPLGMIAVAPSGHGDCPPQSGMDMTAANLANFLR